MTTTPRDAMTRTWNRALDALARIEPQMALNDGFETKSQPSSEIAIELRLLMNELEAAAYTAEQNTFNYHAVRESALYLELQRCAARLAKFDPAILITDVERLAFWVNVYNVLIVHAVIAFRIQETVWQDKGFFRRAAYRIRGIRVSADQIEHGILRRNRVPPYMPLPALTSNDPRRAWSPSYVDARLHTTLNCASRSCPPIAAYSAALLGAQFDLAARTFVNATSRFELRQGNSGVLTLSPIFKWYAQDFGGRQGTLGFVTRYWADEAKAEQMQRTHRTIQVKWSRYDWSLNE